MVRRVVGAIWEEVCDGKAVACAAQLEDGRFEAGEALNPAP